MADNGDAARTRLFSGSPVIVPRPGPGLLDDTYESDVSTGAGEGEGNFAQAAGHGEEGRVSAGYSDVFSSNGITPDPMPAEAPLHPAPPLSPFAATATLQPVTTSTPSRPLDLRTESGTSGNDRRAVDAGEGEHDDRSDAEVAAADGEGAGLLTGAEHARAPTSPPVAAGDEDDEPTPVALATAAHFPAALSPAAPPSIPMFPPTPAAAVPPLPALSPQLAQPPPLEPLASAPPQTTAIAPPPLASPQPQAAPPITINSAPATPASVPPPSVPAVAAPVAAPATAAAAVPAPAVGLPAAIQAIKGELCGAVCYVALR